MPSEVGATSAWISTSKRPRALDAGKHRGAGLAEIALGQEQLGRVGDLAQARAGHLEHADLVGRAEAVLHRAQDAELVRAFALERQHRVDHVLDHAGAGDLAVLGDVADQDDGGAGFLGEADERLRRSRAPGSPCRARIRPVSVHMVWIESMTTRRGVLPSDSVAMMSSTEVSAASSTGASRKPEPLGAQPHLRHRFLAGDVDRAMAGAGERGGGLDQQRRFADAGIAAHQQHRAADEAAAGDAVEFGDAGGQARGLMRVAGERLEREQAALAGLAARARRAARRLPRSACSTRRRPRICPASG